MEFWISFWKIFFILTLALFAVMSVVITIGGYRDLKLLFKKMEEANNAAEDPDA